MSDSTSLNVYSFPDKTLPNSQKGEDWHKQYLLSIMNQTIGGGNLSAATAVMDENFDIFNSQDTGEEFDFLQKSESGDELPAIWLNFNRIRKKCELMMGELTQRGLDIDVKAINKDAVTRKMEYKTKVMAQMVMSELFTESAADIGIDIASQEGMPRNMEELEIFIKSSYKENTEIVMEAAIRYSMEMYKWEYKRIKAFRDMLITGRTFIKCEVRNGYPQPRVIDPRFVVFDPYSQDDFLTDAAYFGEVQYMTFEDCAEKYGLSLKEINDMYQNYSNSEFGNLFWKGASTVGAGFRNYLPFSDINGLTRILVFSAEFIDSKQVRHKESKDRNGNYHYKVINEDIAKKEKKKEASGKVKIISKTVATARRATLIGGYLVKEWGEVPNQPRSLDNPSVTRLSYISVLPNYVNYKTLSLVDQTKGIQKFKNIIMYKTQLEITTAGRKGFSYDISKLPPDMSLDKAMYYLKVAGIAFYNGAQEGMPGSSNPMTPIDNSLSDSVGKFLNVVAYLDSQMDEVSGINEARHGNAPSSQLVGVTKAAIFQSNLMTKTYFDMFRQFEERVWQRLGDFIKVTWPEQKEKFSHIIGDVGINFLEQDVDVDLDDYAIFIKAQPPIIDDENELKEVATLAIQNGNIDLADYIILRGEDDPKVGMRKFLKIVDKKNKMKEQQMAQEQEFMMMQQQQKSEADTNKVLQEQNAIAAGKMQIENVKSERDKVRTDMKNDHETDILDKKTQAEMLHKEIERMERVSEAAKSNQPNK